jgi:glycosyltransferase involved in cell wall biosynthesis
MGDAACTFTVFTATYNRAHTLGRVYDSLCGQTYRSFEWLIVDDGSADGTRALVERWQRQALFPIRYLVQENAGKHVACNRAVREARGALFLTLDSDDACVPEALERFTHHWDAIPPDRKPLFSAVTCLSMDHHGRLVGTRFPHDVTDSDSLEIRYRYGVTGEKWGFHRTDVLREYPFPESVKRHVVPEGIVWSRIARRYKTRFVNEALRIYYTDQPSLVHGVKPGTNAVGARLYYLSVLNEEGDYFRHAPLQFFRSAALYSRASFHLGASLREQASALATPFGRVLWACALPAGFGAFWWETTRSARARSRGRTMA